MKSIVPRFQITAIDSLDQSTSDTRLASTIYAFDVPLHEQNPFTTSAGDGLKGTRVVWHFHQTDPAGNSPKEIHQKWNDGFWIEANPTHPLAICKNAFERNEWMVRQTKMGMPSMQETHIGLHEPNTRKAAVLNALGHPLKGYIRGDRWITWVFDEAAATDAALYDDPRLYERFPDAAISYAKAAILGHVAMITAIKNIQFARVEHRGRTALIGRDMPKDKLDQLEKLLYRK